MQVHSPHNPTNEHSGKASPRPSKTLSKLDELYRLHRLLDGRRAGLSRAALMGEHGFSRSTLTRLIADLRGRLGAPLIHEPERGGYRYDSADGRHHLPGLWFTAEELFALVTLNQLLQNLQPGLLDDHLRPMQNRLHQLLGAAHLGAGEAPARIRILAMASRAKDLRHFKPSPAPSCNANASPSTITTATATKPANAPSPPSA